MNQTGLLFGSFNPIHMGHLAIANYIGEYGGLDDVWLVVTPQSPTKERTLLAAAQHRLAMARLAVAPYPKFRVCDIEFTLPPPHYTIGTLEALRATCPQRAFHLLVGADNWQQLPQWKDCRRLLAEYPLIVYPRFGYDRAIDTEKYPNVRVCAAPRMEISSSFIREAIARGKNMDCFLPAAVVDYIARHQLYQQFP